MQAVLLDRYGPPDVLRLAEVPDPTPGPRDVLVRVRASSVNPVDCKIRAGGQRGVLRYALPWILGLDVSGEVAAVGEQVTRFAVGDAVFGSPSHRRPGCYAELVAIDAGELAHKPGSLTHIEAATLPLVGQTAWMCLMPWLTERPGQQVFVQAGAGGVGSLAIQLARHHGAHVATTCSPKNAQLVSSLGAAQIIDYRTQRFEDVLSEQDIVLDSLGGQARRRAMGVLRRGGRLATIVSGMPGYTERFGPNLAVVAALVAMGRMKVQGLLAGVKTASVLRKPDAQILAQLAALVEQGALRPVVDTVYPLAEIAAAHAHVETGHARGKVAIAVG